ncbi:hypothetical protein GCM10023158_17020 [Gluconacetobacter tumulicola]
MNRGLTMLRGLFHTFGGLVLYWAVLLAFGVRPAIAATLLFMLLEGVWRLLTHRAFPPLWLLANGAALVFGCIDLWARTPFMIRYEGAIINLLTAAAFAVGASGREPIVMTFARRRRPEIPVERPEIICFFRAFTYAWALYFVARAAAFLWIMTAFPLVQAAAIRTMIAWTSLGAMLLVSINGRHVFALCQRFGFFHPAQDSSS